MNEWNANEQRHGYWEVRYRSSGDLIYKGRFDNGVRIGYWEWCYYDDTKLTVKQFYL
jgi:hypothetical protein